MSVVHMCGGLAVEYDIIHECTSVVECVYSAGLYNGILLGGAHIHTKKMDRHIWRCTSLAVVLILMSFSLEGELQMVHVACIG